MSTLGIPCTGEGTEDTHVNKTDIMFDSSGLESKHRQWVTSYHARDMACSGSLYLLRLQHQGNSLEKVTLKLNPERTATLDRRKEKGERRKERVGIGWQFLQILQLVQKDLKLTQGMASNRNSKKSERLENSGKGLSGRRRGYRDGLQSLLQWVDWRRDFNTGIDRNMKHMQGEQEQYQPTIHSIYPPRPPCF